MKLQSMLSMSISIFSLTFREAMIELKKMALETFNKDDEAHMQSLYQLWQVRLQSSKILFLMLNYINF